jgi:hypothetical protein
MPDVSKGVVACCEGVLKNGFREHSDGCPLGEAAKELKAGNMTNDTTKNLRPDWEIARLFAKTKGLVAARDWLRSVFVDLTSEVEPDIQPEEPLDLVFEAWKNLPFLDATYSLLVMFDDTLTGKATPGLVYARITKLNPERVPGTNGSACDVPYWLPDDEALIVTNKEIKQVPTGFIDGTEPGIQAASPNEWPKRRGKGRQLLVPGEWLVRFFRVDPFNEIFWLGNFVVAYEGERPKGLIEACSFNKILPSTKDIEIAANAILNVGGMIALILQRTDKHFVEVKADPKGFSEKRRRKMKKTASKFPWLDETLPHVVLIDPTKVREYREPQGGTHASPQPHQRRGHWRTYRSEKFKNARGQRRRVKPAWIGDREWIHRGSVYRVIDPEQPEGNEDQ